MVRWFRDDDVPGIAAETAFRLVFALPPLAIFFAALSALVDRYAGTDAFSQLLGLAREGLPPPVFGTVDLLLEGLREQGDPGLLSFGLVLALWAASRATYPTEPIEPLHWARVVRASYRRRRPRPGVISVTDGDDDAAGRTGSLAGSPTRTRCRIPVPFGAN